MEQPVSPWVLIGFNVLLGIASFFGAMWLRRMESDMRDMRKDQADALERQSQREIAIQQKLQGYVAKEDFREFRTEIQGNFSAVFDRLDRLVERIPHKGG